jgi:hypothetical protein
LAVGRSQDDAASDLPDPGRLIQADYADYADAAAYAAYAAADAAADAEV